MALLSIGGIHWNPNHIGWGKLGRPQAREGATREMLGYSPKMDGRGKPPAEERQRRTVNVWKCHAVYALFERGECVYVGEGNLGDRMKRHWESDAFVGRWDSFTWLSPWEYELPAGQPAVLNERPDEYQEQVTAKSLVELLELVAIRLGSPNANSQIPSRDKEILWLTQARSQHSSSSLDEKLDEVLQLLRAR